MSMEPEEFENVPPQGHVRVVYLGPVAPHWDIHRVFGDPKAIDEFAQRAQARLRAQLEEVQKQVQALKANYIAEQSKLQTRTQELQAAQVPVERMLRSRRGPKKARTQPKQSGAIDRHVATKKLLDRARGVGPPG